MFILSVSSEPGDIKVKKPLTVTPKTFLKMSADMEKYAYGLESTRYLREVSGQHLICLFVLGFMPISTFFLTYLGGQST